MAILLKDVYVQKESGYTSRSSCTKIILLIQSFPYLDFDLRQVITGISGILPLPLHPSVACLYPLKT